MEKEDADYLAMLNNKTINPDPRQQEQQQSSSPAINVNTAEPFEALTSACHAITGSSKELSLVSETDAPFEWVSTNWSSDDLPTAQDILKLGWADDMNASRSKTLDQFFEPMTDENNDPYGQAKRYQALHKKLKEVFSDKPAKVYLLGEESVTVLILGIISSKGGSERTRALAGLRSLLVQT
ncbi:hypothetical protein BDB00DRAFT_783972 [Zychaea mexicana]|uniref:uncharacterized protein n=1 Tax=Zychaea mexicana TaxID=64656 RepID=UPI0022FE93AB|nr:uncharacterized protein BDB00DRAFT_783972 [Zychaea mexicana]KAI9498342.1 hypothetical protein BDB00DRAFT_783972 [Zychaea mexicana]